MLWRGQGRMDSAQLNFVNFAWQHLIDRSNQDVKKGFRKILVSLPCGSVAVVVRFLKSCEFCNKSGHVEKLVCDLTAVVGLHDFVRRSCGSPTKPIDYFKIAIVRQPYGSRNSDVE